MGGEDMILGNHFWDLGMRWILLVAGMLLLVYVARERVTIEGYAGFLLTLFLVVPINIFARDYLWQLGMGELPSHSAQGIAVYYGLVLIINLVLFFAFNKVLGIVTISSNLALVLFTAVFSGFSTLIRYVPSFGSLLADLLGVPAQS